MRTQLNYKLVLPAKRDQRLFEKICSYLLDEDARALLLDRWDLVRCSPGESHVEYLFNTSDSDVIAALQNPDNWLGPNSAFQLEGVMYLHDGTTSFCVSFGYTHIVMTVGI